MLFLFALYFHSVSEFEVTIYSANIRFGEDVLKTSWRRLENIFSVTSSKRLQDKIARRLLEDFLRRLLANTFWRRLTKVSCKHLLKTSWRRLGRQKIVTVKTFSRRLEDVLENKKCLLGRIDLIGKSILSINYPVSSNVLLKVKFSLANITITIQLYRQTMWS